jgi:small subunit ribosomal protein S15
LHKKTQRVKAAAKYQPSVVLGTRPNEEGEKWKNSALAKIIIDEDSLSPSPELKPEEFMIGKVNVPKHLGFGVDTEEKKMLFDVLPKLTAEMAQQTQVKQGKVNEDDDSNSENLKTQLDKANMFAKVLDLQNANAKGITYVNTRRIVYAFSTPENPYNPGHTEVQGAQPNQVH